MKTNKSMSFGKVEDLENSSSSSFDEEEEDEDEEKERQRENTRKKKTEIKWSKLKYRMAKKSEFYKMKGKGE